MAATNDGEVTKRITKCTGCSEPITEHTWGISSKFCEGKSKSSPRKEAFQCENHLDHMEDEEIGELESIQANLCVEEEQLAKKKRKALLQKQIEGKPASLVAYSDAAVQGNGPATVKQLRGFTPSDVTTPLDGILNPLQPQTSQEGQTPWSMLQQSSTLPSFQASPAANASLESKASKMFLRGYFRGDWFYFNFALDNPSWSSLHINHKEMLAIMLATRHWAPQRTNHRVIIYSENQAAGQILNKGTTANELIMDELHNLFWLSAAYNFHISATHIEGARNTIADAISRIPDLRHLNTFCALLLDHLPRVAVDQLRLNDHLSVHSRSFAFSRCTGSPAGGATPPGNAQLSRATFCRVN